MVNFRLSASEYDFVSEACRAEGARSLSDFARTAALKRAQTCRQGVNVTVLEQHEKRIAELERMIGADAEGRNNHRREPAKTVLTSDVDGCSS